MCNPKWLFIAICFSTLAQSAALTVSGQLSTSTVNGTNLGAGTYTSDQLSNLGSLIGTVSSGSFSGPSVWVLLGGNASGTASNVITDSSKNAILRSYLLATNTNGARFIISLGEVNPFFGGAASTAPFIAADGGNSSPALIFPGQGAEGRNVQDLGSLTVLSVPQPSIGPGGPSTSFQLTGNVRNPGQYGNQQLRSLPAVTETVAGNTYTGVRLWNFLDVSGSDIFEQYVLAEGTDGYEVLFSLAELDPAFGAPNGLCA